MPKGNLVVHISDMSGALMKGRIDLDFRRVEGSSGAGGENMEVSVNGPVGTLTVTGLHCQTGPGTMYEVRASTDHYRRYAFFQLIQEDRDNVASDDIEFWVKPGDVEDISAPAFDKLPKAVRRMCDEAEMIAELDEDADLLNLKGADLYRALGPLRKACLLNLAKKAADETTADNCLPMFGGLLISRQDRIFAKVTAGLVEQLQNASMFKSAPDILHKPPAGYALTKLSFKSRDPHANLQVTFMTDLATGALVADIDIDESSGIEHGFEVIHNAVFHKRTNPFVIREFLNAADFTNHSLNPDYTFRF